MKKLCPLFSLLILITASGIPVAAQKTATYAQTNTQLWLNKNVIAVNNLSFTDALGADNQVQHTASFDFQLTDDAAARTILRLLQLYTKEGAGCQLLFVTTNFNGEPLQERAYENTIVEEILLPALDAASKMVFKATVKIRSGAVKLQKGETKAALLKRSKNSAFASNFSLSIGNLPTTRVTRISGLSIKPEAGQYINFSIEIMSIDGAAWNQWFLTGAAGLKKEQGNIRLLSPNLADILYEISLSDLEIVSYSGGSGNQQAPGRATIGLRTKSISLK